MAETNNNGPVGIKSWAKEDKPREKLRDRGYSLLSDAELIAILIGSGTRELSAVALARKVQQRNNEKKLPPNKIG